SFCSKNFFAAADKYRNSHCNTLETWITQHSSMPCAIDQRWNRRRYFGSTAARFTAGASNTEFVDEFTDVPMPSFFGDWKRIVFYRRRLLARSAYLVGQSGAGASGSALLTTQPVDSERAPRAISRISISKCRSELGWHSAMISIGCRRRSHHLPRSARE